MSAFICDDVVAFKDDPSIKGIVEITWSDVDPDPPDEFPIYYIHESLPPQVKETWLYEDKLPPGYVVVSLMDMNSACCLISEASLDLVDRAMAIGDVVKKSSAHAESGIVLSTSITCELQPVCSEIGYNFTRLTRASMLSLSVKYPDTREERTRRGLLSRKAKLPKTPESPRLMASAQDLTHCSDYREEDFVIYRDWVGQVEEVYDEVTIRLSNGSVVVVQESDELMEPHYVPGSRPYKIDMRLAKAGYCRELRDDEPDALGPLSAPVAHFYPGLRVETKKGNLRRGRWKFGAYDPNGTFLIHIDSQNLLLEPNWASFYFPCIVF